MRRGFSTADALVATIVHTFTKIWGGILYGVLLAFAVFIVLYCIAKSIRNKNIRLREEVGAKTIGSHSSQPNENVNANANGDSGVIHSFDDVPR